MDNGRAIGVGAAVELSLPTTVGIALLVLGWCNLNFYANRYSADPESFKEQSVQVGRTELRGTNGSEPVLGILERQL
jgi:hypothetical protein